jgi:hypothetical protein
LTYRRSAYRRDQIAEHGQTVALPLFEATGKHISDVVRTRIENAPKAVRSAIDTRRLAHILLTFDAIRLSEKQEKVLRVLIDENAAMTNTEIAHKMDWPINCVVGRVFELRHLGIEGKPFVVDGGRRRCTITGEVVHAWRFNPGLPAQGIVNKIREGENNGSQLD